MTQSGISGGGGAPQTTPIPAGQFMYFSCRTGAFATNSVAGNAIYVLPKPGSAAQADSMAWQYWLPGDNAPVARWDIYLCPDTGDYFAIPETPNSGPQFAFYYSQVPRPLKDDFHPLDYFDQYPWR